VQKDSSSGLRFHVDTVRILTPVPVKTQPEYLVMPLAIDATRFPNLAAIQAARRYPDSLKAVFNLPRTDPFPQIDVVTAFTAAPPLRGKTSDITWYGFRSVNRQRLPEFYACELPASQLAAPVDLYEIGAVGNNFDVDVLLTDAVGTPQNSSPSTALFEKPKSGGAAVAAALTALYFYEAKRALWNAPTGAAPGFPTNKMTLSVPAAGFPGKPCILWAVSYRHERYGNRPQSLVFAAASPAAPVGPLLHQDDDGSPGDGEPGGEGE
jgi:hypothetical protein